MSEKISSETATLIDQILAEDGYPASVRIHAIEKAVPGHIEFPDGIVYTEQKLHKLALRIWQSLHKRYDEAFVCASAKAAKSGFTQRGGSVISLDEKAKIYFRAGFQEGPDPRDFRWSEVAYIEQRLEVIIEIHVWCFCTSASTEGESSHFRISYDRNDIVQTFRRSSGYQGERDDIDRIRDKIDDCLPLLYKMRFPIEGRIFEVAVNP